MTGRFASGTFAAIALVMPAALAADAPALTPSRDVAVIYQTQQGATLLEQHMRWSAASRRMRIDPPTPGMFLLVDYAGHRMDIVREAERSVLEMDAPSTMPGIGAPMASAYARGGDDAIAGIPCVEWTATGRQGQSICVTADGVLLRVRFGTRVVATAAEVRYEPQDPALFRIPAGYAKTKASR